MPLKTQAGQVLVKNQVQIPIIDWVRLGLVEKGSYKSYFTTNFIPLGELVLEDETGRFVIGGTDTDKAKSQLFKYTFVTPDPDKPAKKNEFPVKWHNESWADTMLRKSEGDAYDDPGFALGLHLKQEDRKMTPGFDGAPDRTFPIIDAYKQFVRIPVIWNVTVDDEGEIDEKTGELAWLELSFSQYNLVMTTVAKYAKQQMLQDKRRKEQTPANRLFVIKYTKDPKKDNRERNSVEMVTFFNPNPWTETFIKVASIEYPKTLEYMEKKYNYFKPVVDALLEGTITAEEATERAHAMVAERLLISWGEIDENSGLSAESINQLFLSLVPQYSAAMTAAIPEAAIKSKVVVDVSDEDVPF
jgi:hypothetical protein